MGCGILALKNYGMWDIGPKKLRDVRYWTPVAPPPALYYDVLGQSFRVRGVIDFSRGNLGVSLKNPHDITTPLPPVSAGGGVGWIKNKRSLRPDIQFSILGK